MGLRSRSRQKVPAGTIWMYYGTAAPPGWLECNGQSTTGYAALAAEVGANVPDMRGRAPIAAGTGSGLTNRVLGTQYGAESTSLAIANMPSHNHGGGNHTHALTTHTHTGGNHDHGSNGHGHSVAHDHGPHAHQGTQQYASSSLHDHGASGGLVAGNPGGYFTGNYHSSDGQYAVASNPGTGGPSAWDGGQVESGGPNTVGSNPSSGAVLTSQGSGTAVGTMPPVLALMFIIKI